MPNQPEQEADAETLQRENDGLRKRIKELEAELAGKIPQVSSAPLGNYPEAAYDYKEKEEEPKVDQPRTGAAATASEK